MNGFGAVLEAIAARISDPASATQQAAQARYGRRAEVALGVHPDRVPKAVPHVVILDGDEEAVTEGRDRPAIGRLRCRRHVECVLALPRRSDHLADANALLDALVEDLARKPLDGAVRVDYEGSASDYEGTENLVLRSASFWVLYNRT